MTKAIRQSGLVIQRRRTALDRRHGQPI